jgi:hypothetical protein
MWVGDNLNFDIDANVSVFETNIRVVGGLLSGALSLACFRVQRGEPMQCAPVRPRTDTHSPTRRQLIFLPWTPLMRFRTTRDVC